MERAFSQPVIAPSSWMEKLMKIIAVAAAVLLGTVAFANAAEKKGASSMSPGHEMQNSPTKTGKGASEYSPGDKMQDKGTVGSARGSSKGASEYSPGDKMNDKKSKY
jgi:hypothetical protein